MPAPTGRNPGNRIPRGRAAGPLKIAIDTREKTAGSSQAPRWQSSAARFRVVTAPPSLANLIADGDLTHSDECGTSHYGLPTPSLGYKTCAEEHFLAAFLGRKCTRRCKETALLNWEPTGGLEPPAFSLPSRHSVNWGDREISSTASHRKCQDSTSLLPNF
jgi:hypothetical protein